MAKTRFWICDSCGQQNRPRKLSKENAAVEKDTHSALLAADPKATVGPLCEGCGKMRADVDVDYTPVGSF